MASEQGDTPVTMTVRQCREENKRCIPLDNLHDDSVAPVSADAPNSSVLDDTRKLSAEFWGTGMLVYGVVGSGIMGQTLSDDVGVQLLINTLGTVGVLYVLITILGPVSGAHFNPIVSMVDVFYKDMQIKDFAMYVIAQVSGAILGGVMANVQFAVPVAISTKDRFANNLWISEVIATASLVVLIHGCIRTGQKSVVPGAVAFWVGSGYLFTASTIFANPAVTIGRIFSDTFAGINPQSAGVFIICQIAGAVLGYGFILFHYPKDMHVNKDDNLYRRAVLITAQSFINRGHY